MRSVTALQDAIVLAQAKHVELGDLLERVAALAAGTPAPDPVPVPVPDPVPANLVAIGAATFPVAAVNPTPGSNPLGFQQQDWAGRGADQLVIYAPPLASTGTNQWGTEAIVTGGAVAAVESLRGNAAVPTGGCVLSGHGAAAAWLRANAVPGAQVTLSHTGQPAPAPVPVPVPSPGQTGRTLAVYLMDGVGHIGQVPANVTQIRVAFLRDGGLVEWGGDSPAQTAADLTAWRAARPGRQILLSIGGSGGAVTVASMPAAVRAVKAFPVDGVDWDIESGGFDVAAVVAASQAMAAGRPGWATSFVPPGGPPVAVALAAAKQCRAAGMAVQFGFQGYDAVDSDADIIGRTADAVAALGDSSTVVGFMVGDDAKHRTVDECESLMRQVSARWPGIGGVYLWESSRPGTAEWARRVGAVLGL